MGTDCLYSQGAQLLILAYKRTVNYESSNGSGVCKTRGSRPAAICATDSPDPEVDYSRCVAAIAQQFSWPSRFSEISVPARP